MIKSDIAKLKRKAEANLKTGHAREFWRGQIAVCTMLLEKIERSEEVDGK